MTAKLEEVPTVTDVAPASEKQSEPAPATAPQDLVTEEKKPETEEKKTEEPAAAPTEELKKLDISEEKKTEHEATAAVAAAPLPAATRTGAEATPPAAAAAAVAAAEKPEEKSEGLVWPETGADHPLTKFYDLFEELVKESEHDEVYGIKLSKSSPFHTKLILQKFLRANANDLTKAKQQLLETLKWRKEFDPAKAAEETFSKERFEGLGYVLEVEGVPESVNEKDIVTFNIYGAVKDNKKTFGDLEGFLRWRVGLMERSVQALHLSTATRPIPDYNTGPDPYQGFQIHDYLQVSFLRRDPVVKEATNKTIETLGRYYPETLSRKFFVNVPAVMGWVYQAVKLVVAKETAKKFTVLSYGNQLATELGKGIPKEYGGTAGSLEEAGVGMKLE